MDIQETVYKYLDSVLVTIFSLFLIIVWSSLVIPEVNLVTGRIMQIISPFLPFLMVLIPIVVVLYARWHDKYEAKRIVEEVKNKYEPIVTETVTVEYTNVEVVYTKCMNWLSNRNADIFEEEHPHYILAFEAGSYSMNVDSDDAGIPSDVLRWAKFLQLRLYQNGSHVNVLFDVHQGWKKIEVETYEKRKKTYPSIIQDFREYIIQDE